MPLSRKICTLSCAFGRFVSLRADTDRCRVDETAASTPSGKWVKSLWHPWQVPVIRAVPLSPPAPRHTLACFTCAPRRPACEDHRSPVDPPWFGMLVLGGRAEEAPSCNWAPWPPGADNLRLPFRDEDACSFPTFLAALLKVRGVAAECLYHSLCTASP